MKIKSKNNEPPSRVLVRLPNWVGDAVMATCCLRAIHGAGPSVSVAVAAKHRYAGLLEDLPYIDDFIPLRTGSVREAIRLGRTLRGRFDTAFILPNSFKSCLLPWCAGVPERIGYAGQWRGALLTRKVKAPKGPNRRRLPEPMPHYWKRLLDAAGVPWQGDAPELAVGEATLAEARKGADRMGLPAGAPFAALSPGAAFGPSKLWLPERFAKVAELLYQRLGLPSVLFLAPGEEAVAQAIMDCAVSPIISTASDPISLSQLKAFMKWCRLLVSTDSGTRHIGVAFKVPTVTIMGPTDHRYTDYCHDRQVVLYGAADCRPCHLKSCPTDHRCMTEVTADRVVREALKLLESCT